MAEVPTFKLVLVGDGGTGKVSKMEELPASLVRAREMNVGRTIANTASSCRPPS